MQGKKSFRYAASVLWNSLPDDFRTTVDFNRFKHLFLIGMAKIVNVQPTRLCFKLFYPTAHVAAYENFLCGFCCIFVLCFNSL